MKKSILFLTVAFGAFLGGTAEAGYTLTMKPSFGCGSGQMMIQGNCISSAVQSQGDCPQGELFLDDGNCCSPYRTGLTQNKATFCCAEGTYPKSTGDYDVCCENEEVADANGTCCASDRLVASSSSMDSFCCPSNKYVVNDYGDTGCCNNQDDHVTSSGSCCPYDRYGRNANFQDFCCPEGKISKSVGVGSGVYQICCNPGEGGTDDGHCCPYDRWGRNTAGNDFCCAENQVAKPTGAFYHTEDYDFPVSVCCFETDEVVNNACCPQGKVATAANGTKTCCSGNQVPVDGLCCDQGQIVCSGQCVTGSCCPGDNTCTGGKSCVAHQCVCPYGEDNSGNCCSQGQVVCNGQCAASCDECNPGYHKRGSSCVPDCTSNSCPSGQSCDATTKECKCNTCMLNPDDNLVGVESYADCTCKKGYTADACGTVCTWCEPGTYKDWIGMGACLPCPEDYSSPEAATSADQCISVF